MDFQSQKAIYLQIADHLCEQILLKRWEAHSKMPSVRELAISLQVNPNTIMRTYAFLEEKNIIATQRGIGYFITDSAQQNILSLKKAEFLSVDLPKIFRSMDLLNIDFENIKQLYMKRFHHEKKY